MDVPQICYGHPGHSGERGNEGNEEKQYNYKKYIVLDVKLKNLDDKMVSMKRIP